MTKQELALIIKDIEKVRTLLLPWQAEQVPNLFPKLTEYKQVKQGQRFNIQGEVFEAIEDIIDLKDRIPQTSNKWTRPMQKRGR
jgi:hypothetical protein